jgi:hypothetical protein
MACWPAPWLKPAVTRSCADVQPAAARDEAAVSRDDDDDDDDDAVEVQAASVRTARAVTGTAARTLSEGIRM